MAKHTLMALGDMMGLKKVLFSGAFWSLLSLLVSGLSGFILLPVMLRYLGADGVGLFALLTLFSLSGFAQILELGFQTTTAKYVAEYRGQKNDEQIAALVGTVLQVYFALGALIAIGGFFAAEAVAKAMVSTPSLASDFLLCLRLLFLSFTFTLPYLVMVGVLSGYHRFTTVKSIEILGHLLRLLGTLVVLLLGGGLVDVFILQMAIQLLQFLAILVAAVRLLPRGSIPGHFCFTILKEISPLSGLLFVGRVCSITFKQTDRFLLAAYFSPEVVGRYEATTKMPYLVKGVAGAATDVLLPTVSFMDTDDFPRIQRLFYRSLKWQMAIAVPPGIFLIVFAEEILRFWLGADYLSLAYGVRLAAVSILLVPMQNVGGNFLIGLGRGVRESTVSNIVTSALNLGLTVMFVRNHAIVGALWATVLSGIVSVIWHFGIFRKALGISVWQSMMSIVRVISFGVVLVLMSLVGEGRPLELHVFVGLAVGYFALYGMYVHRVVFDDSDRKTLRQLVLGVRAKFFGAH
ncbi:MAG: oligosaccharide flippase family protein [Bdellovibrionaceae bacterium]|nr:oligosaccharide flippase family protein [Pseudobdellovibrionaceae bacterium]